MTDKENRKRKMKKGRRKDVTVEYKIVGQVVGTEHRSVPCSERAKGS